MIPQTQAPELEFVTYADFTRHSIRLSELIRERELKFDILISINRGGAVLSRILSDLLGDIPILAFAMKSYTGIDQRSELRLTQPLSDDLAGQSVLIVDEICDTGATFQKAVEYVQTFHPQSIETACLYVKPHSTFHPRYTVVSTPKWVVFPYDVCETLRNLRKFWSTDENLKKKIADHFQSIGIPPEWIDQTFESLIEEKSAGKK